MYRQPSNSTLFPYTTLFRSVEHGANTAERRTGDERVADPQRAALHQHRGDRTATAVEVRLDGEALGVLVGVGRSEEHTSELQSPCNLVCRLLLEKKKQYKTK